MDERQYNEWIQWIQDTSNVWPDQKNINKTPYELKQSANKIEDALTEENMVFTPHNDKENKLNVSEKQSNEFDERLKNVVNNDRRNIKIPLILKLHARFHPKEHGQLKELSKEFKKYQENASSVNYNAIENKVNELLNKKGATDFFKHYIKKIENRIKQHKQDASVIERDDWRKIFIETIESKDALKPGIQLRFHSFFDLNERKELSKISKAYEDYRAGFTLAKAESLRDNIAELLSHNPSKEFKKYLTDLDKRLSENVQDVIIKISSENKPSNTEFKR